MKRRIILIGLSVFAGLIQDANAQTELDALRYSQVEPVGTGRYSAMGGAFGALGGDMSSIIVNPAGVAVFMKSTGTFTFDILSSNTDATYRGTTSSDDKLNLNISNAGFVARFVNRRWQERQWDWKSFHFGVVHNRTANFNRRTSVVGVNTESSAIDGWVDQLNSEGVTYDNIPSELIPGSVSTPGYLGWHTFLIDTVPGSTDLYRRNVLPNYGQTQRVTELTRGSMSEVAVAFGGNFGNVLYIGATLGFPRLSYELERSYTESDTQDTIAGFSSFTRTDYLQTTGTGVNFKFGMIYRPVKWLRIGAAVHTPSFIDMDESFSSLMLSNLDGARYSYSTLDGVFDYSLKTPFRTIGSLGFVIGKIGLISADYEYVNYSLARFRSRNYGFDQENNDVRTKLKWAGNIRIGTEWRLGMFSLRGGFGVNADPYTSALNFDNTNYSFGAGIRFNRFFVDLAYSLHRMVGVYQVYDLDSSASASTVTLDHNVLTTVGFRF